MWRYKEKFTKMVYLIFTNIGNLLINVRQTISVNCLRTLQSVSVQKMFHSPEDDLFPGSKVRKKSLIITESGYNLSSHWINE